MNRLWHPTYALDRNLTNRAIEQTLGQKVFAPSDSGSSYDTASGQAALTRALGRSVFTPMSVLDPALARLQIDGALAGGGGGAGPPTFDPATIANVTLSNGNLTANHINAGSTGGARLVNYQSTGKFYCEFKINHYSAAGTVVGLLQQGATYAQQTTGGANTTEYFANYLGGCFYTLGSDSGKRLGAAVDGDVIGIAVDLAAARIWYRRNTNAWQGDGSGDPAAGTGGFSIGAGIWTPGCTLVGDATEIITGNFGATPYLGAVPSGYGNWPATPSAFPMFVNAGTITSANGTTNTPAMPANIVAGNLLVSWIVVTQRAGVNLAVSAGWTIGDQFCIGTSLADATCVGWAWRVATGSDAAPTWTWAAGAANFTANVFQITNNATSFPIGTVSKAFAQASTSINIAGITTQAANSLILGFIGTQINAAIGTPSGYATRIGYNSANGSEEECDQVVAAKGGTSSALTVSTASTTWDAMLAEVKVLGTPAPAWPTFVSVGTQAVEVVGASSTAGNLGGMPANIAVGNLLISFILVNGRASTVLSISGTGWTIGDQFCLGGTFADATCVGWAWKIATGSDTAPTWSWATGNAYFTVNHYQYTGNAASPIGATAHNSAQTSTTVNVNGITTTKANSLVIGLFGTYSTILTPNAAGYAGRFTFGAATSGSGQLGDQPVVTLGAASSNFTITVPSTTWVGMLLEVKSP